MQVVNDQEVEGFAPLELERLLRPNSGVRAKRAEASVPPVACCAS